MAYPTPVNINDQIKDSFTKVNLDFGLAITGITFTSSTNTLTLQRMDGSSISTQLLFMQGSVVNFYVDGNNGSDITGDGSIVNPFQTMQWAAYKARIYSQSSLKPVTIFVFAANYTINDTNTSTPTTVVGNLWVYGGWQIYPGTVLTHLGTGFTFSSSNVPSGEYINNCVVRGDLQYYSANGGCIEHKSYGGGINYSLDFQWKFSETKREFLVIDKTGGANAVGVTLRDGQANVTYFHTPCIFAINRPVLFANNCTFFNESSTDMPNLNFSGGTDSLGIYCTLKNSTFGVLGELGQINIQRHIRILDIENCVFTGFGPATRPAIEINIDLTTDGVPRLLNNKVIKRDNNEGSVLTSYGRFIKANQSAVVFAFGNDCQSSGIEAAATKTLTTRSVPITFPTSAITSTVYPSSMITRNDNVSCPAYNIWI